MSPRRAAAAATALSLALCAAPAAAQGLPAAGVVHLLAALERSPAAVVVVFEAPRKVDGEAWQAEGTVERSLYGGETGLRIAIAWEERARQRAVRFAAGDRVLLALEPLPGDSIWRQRFSDAEERARTLYVAEQGGAFLRDPSPGSLLVLEHYLKLLPELRELNAGVGYLVKLAEQAEPELALAAVERLAEIEPLDPEIDPSSAQRLVVALLRRDAPEPLVQGLLALAQKGPLRSLRPPLESLAARDPLAPALVFEALGRVQPGGLTAGLSLRLLEQRESPSHRAAGARFAAGAAVERLPRVLRSDPVPAVRGAAAQRWLEERGVEGAPQAGPALHDSDPEVRMQTLMTLAGFGAEAVPTLRDALPAASPELARQIVAALVKAGGPEARRTLIELAETHPDEGVRMLAGTTLGRPIGHQD